MRWMKFQFGLQVAAAMAVFALPGFIAAQQKPHPDRPPQRQPQVHANQQHPVNPESSAEPIITRRSIRMPT